MTFTGWIIFIIITLFIIAICISICAGLSDEEHKIRGRIITIIVAIICIAALFFGMRFYYTKTASGSRALRDNYSNLNNGLERSIKQVDDDGNVLFEFSGKCDIETDHEGGYILWDDENGVRHILYKSLTSSILIEDL